ncbi:MAG: NADH-quinone oxidoreductase subunit N [Isosphaeraceae bacterium]
MPEIPTTFNPRDFFILMPQLSLALWGLVILLADVLIFRSRPADERRGAIGRLALFGSVFSMVAAVVPLVVRFDLYGTQEWLNLAHIDYLSDPDPYLFFGTLSSDMMSEVFSLLLASLLVLVVWMSSAWSFTDDWGEYYALLLWSAVGTMLLVASEELVTLFLTLETMTICLYLITAFEKSKRRSVEGGLKYFVYGSVSSALFLYGLSLIYGLTGSTSFWSIRQALLPSGGYNAGLAGNVAGATAVLLLLVGFGFKVAAVPFHQWAPDAYEGAPAPVTAWVATGSKIASFVALMKVLLHALGPWGSSATSAAGPGWIGVVAVLSAASMTYGNFAALAQTNFKRMLAYSSIAHAGYMLVGVAAAGVSAKHEESAGSVLFYLVTYAFANVGAFAVAAWLARDKGTERISDLNGLGFRHPVLATCILMMMLSLIGIPPFAGFIGKVYMFMEALNQSRGGRLTLLWLVALGLMNSVVSAFYYVRVLKAMFLRQPEGTPLSAPPNSILVSIVLGAGVSLALGISPADTVNVMKSVALPMLQESGKVGRLGAGRVEAPGANVYRPQPLSDRDRQLMQPAALGGGGMRPPTPPPAPPAKKSQATPKAESSQPTPAPKDHPAPKDQPKAK